MLSHQDIILFPLLLSLDLSIKVVLVLLLHLFLLFFSLLFHFFDVHHALRHLIGINRIVGSGESLLLFLFLNLAHKGSHGIVFVPIINVTLPAYIPLLLGISLRHLLQHHLFVSFGRLN